MRVDYWKRKRASERKRILYSHWKCDASNASDFAVRWPWSLSRETLVAHYLPRTWLYNYSLQISSRKGIGLIYVLIQWGQNKICVLIEYSQKSSLSLSIRFLESFLPTPITFSYLYIAFYIINLNCKAYSAPILITWSETLPKFLPIFALFECFEHLHHALASSTHILFTFSY